MKHVFKKVIYYIAFIGTAVALYILLSRYNARTVRRIGGDFKELHKSNKRLAEYLSAAESNAKDITTGVQDAVNDNTASRDIAKKLAETNERFRKLLVEIQKNPGN